ncbi:GNAT family N-acetyltransferase [Halorussus halophilus]|uniref:GNAT family N-acetyltransferase n=1 Tax=Halorussus halophilus TaxID=2650975 RepID=UPI00130183E8|nr:GNAT family N-acetyltransferase [Halorussus halophilus]
MSLQEQRENDDGEYRIRWYESGDADGVLSLFETAWNRRPTLDWFDWKFGGDPYLSHVPVNVAERDGQIVGAQAYLPCRVRQGPRDDSLLALKPVDALVHPDHRKQGLYTRITEAAIDFYTDREPAFFYNFPNVASLGAQQKLGWSEVDVVTTYYRLQRPSELLSDDASPLKAGLGRVADLGASAHLGVRDALTSGSDEFEVTRHDTVPANALESLYESQVPDELHIHREAQFYRWFFTASGYDHTTYVARKNGHPVAAVVTRTSDGQSVNVMEALPMISPPTDALATLLGAVVADNPGANVISVTDETLPDELLSRFGFLSYENPVLSRVGTPTYVAARPLWPDHESGPIRRSELLDSDNWRLSFTEVKD